MRGARSSRTARSKPPAGLTVDDDSEFAEPIDDMWLQTFYRLNSLKRKTNQ